MAMNYDCNVRRGNAMLQVRKSGILISHRIELPHMVLLGARDERREAVLSNEISSTSRLPSLTPRAALSKCIRSKRQAGSCGLCGTHIPPQRDAMLSRRASVVKKPQPRLAAR